jgi:hypothetical protein
VILEFIEYCGHGLTKTSMHAASVSHGTMPVSTTPASEAAIAMRFRKSARGRM